MTKPEATLTALLASPGPDPGQPRQTAAVAMLSDAKGHTRSVVRLVEGETYADALAAAVAEALAALNPARPGQGGVQPHPDVQTAEAPGRRRSPAGDSIPPRRRHGRAGQKGLHRRRAIPGAPAGCSIMTNLIGNYILVYTSTGSVQL